jgi:hypothetical protein
MISLHIYNAVGKLDWFWIPWFFERAYPDLAVKSAVIKENNSM